MAEYTVSVVSDSEYALAYAQEVYAAQWRPEVSEGETPPPPPTVEQMPQVLVDADLANRLREMTTLAADLLPKLAGKTPAEQHFLIETMVPSPALRAYIQSKR